LRQFKPYPAYKDSGVQWLGEIPAHWSALAFRRLVRRIEQGWSPVAEDRLAGLDEWAVIRLSAVAKGRFLPDQHKALPAHLAPDTRYEIHEGDFLLTRANTPDLVGDVCVARGVRPKLMLCDLVYRLQLRGARLNPNFLAYWLVSSLARYQIEVDARGSSQSMVKVSQGHIRAWMLLLPPEEEQRAIAAFLERETARIDGLLAKKERLIEVLQEKRAALITRAVTKGLDPSVPMKDSGCEWLGQIPTHWHVLAARRLIRRIEQGWSPVADDRDAALDEWGVIKLSAVNRGRFLPGEHKALPADLAPDTRYEIRDGDFLLSRANTPELVGDVCTVRHARPRLMLCDLVYRLQLRTDRVASPYLAYWFLSRAGRYQIEVEARGASQSMVKVSQGLIRAWTVAFPPLAEQDAIVTFLDAETAKIDLLVAKVGEALNGLKELRTALISAAVTGKIDVRAA
jgi:type I restriction enzyme S subunit